MNDRLTPDASLSDVERRLSNMIRFGVVAEADYARARLRVRCGDLLTDWIPFAALRAGGDKTWHPPEVGEQVVMAAANGDLRQAVVLGAVNSVKNPAPGDRATRATVVYGDGTTLAYDREAHAYALQINAAGTFKLSLGTAAIEARTDAITLSVGGSSIEITAGGLKLSAPRIDLN
jgi:phage baseplate assembly protein V